MAKNRRRQAQSATDDTTLSINMRRSAVSLAVAAALPGAVVAQEAGPIEEIVVTASISQSIMDSVDAKRMADSISDVVDAGALGALPDQSIADALGRVPGVTTIRDSGQSSQLNIRGMDGDFIQTTLNGREQAATSGYAEVSRWMSFDQYPAELINQAAVYKSPKASQLEGGVAGIVELKTANPLQARKQHNFVLNARLSQNDAADEFGGDEDGYRLTGSYQGKFADETFGVALGYSYLDQPNAFILSRAGADDPDSVGYSIVDVNDDGTDERIPRAFQWQAGTGTDNRQGIIAAFNWEPNDKFKAKADYFHSEFDRDDQRTGITASGFAQSMNGTAFGNISNSVISGPSITDGVVTSATIAAVTPNIAGARNHPWFEARTEDQTTVADSTTYGINLEWYPTDRSTLTFDAYRSEGEKTREDRIATLHAYEFGTNGPDTFQEVPGQSMTYTLNGTNPATASFSGVDFTDPDTIRLGRYERYPHLYKDKIDAFKVDFKQDLDWGPISSIEAGVRISDREFETERGTFQFGSREGVWFDGTDGYCEANYTESTSNPIPCAPQSVDGFVKVQSLPGVPDHFYVTDINALGASVFGRGIDRGYDSWQDNWTLINDTTLNEETEAVYLMANLDFQLGNVPVSGNIGVRYIDSKVRVAGLNNAGGGNGESIVDDFGVVDPSNEWFFNPGYGPDFDDTLPSLNLAFELSDNDILRFAAAKVMSRPPVGNMISASGNWSGGPNPNFGGLTEFNVWNDGNPYLDPFRADQLDLSYEHYFEDGGAVTAAVFHKDIESLVEGPVNSECGAVDPASVGVSVPEGSFLCIYRAVINNDRGGYIRGFELAGTRTFSGLPGMWSGLGATASYSYTESEMEIVGGDLLGGDTTQPLPGLSEVVWSATIFYDWERFSAHVNTRYRDEFIQRIPVPGVPQPAKSLDYTTVDAQVSYAFDNGISVVLSGNNLTDEPARIEYAAPGLLGDYRTFGRQYYLGVNYVY
jgi:phosphoribosylformimino-5-aminoimidazole carboxamide ribotide isomerase